MHVFETGTAVIMIMVMMPLDGTRSHGTGSQTDAAAGGDLRVTAAIRVMMPVDGRNLNRNLMKILQ